VRIKERFFIKKDLNKPCNSTQNLSNTPDINVSRPLP
jgi:hypothetical protein